MNKLYQPHPDNAPGDFYVAADSCLSCEATRDETKHDAPELIAEIRSSEKDQGCYFKKQPDPDELQWACEAVAVSCCKMVRYVGDDPSILRMLYDKSAYGSCDIHNENQTLPEQLVRQHVLSNAPISCRREILWTYSLEVQEGAEVIACCFKETGTLTAVKSLSGFFKRWFHSLIGVSDSVLRQLQDGASRDDL